MKKSLGKIFIISGPSQVGKDSIVRKLHHRRSLNLIHVITNTTRSKRLGEKHKIYINFLTDKQFDKLIATNKLLEWAMFSGFRYGTSKQPVLKALQQGHNVILNIEYQGARQVKSKIPEAVLIFINAESPKEIKRRIYASPKMTVTQKLTRWQTAQKELQAKKHFTYEVINRRDKLEETVNEVAKIIKTELKSP